MSIKTPSLTFLIVSCCRESEIASLSLMKLFLLTCIFQQAAELAEFTAKIALLEEAKRKKEDEATEWQHKVMSPSI